MSSRANTACSNVSGGCRAALVTPGGGKERDGVAERCGKKEPEKIKERNAGRLRSHACFLPSYVRHLCAQGDYLVVSVSGWGWDGDVFLPTPLALVLRDGYHPGRKKGMGLRKKNPETHLWIE